MLSFILNDKIIRTELPPGMTVLDFVRYHQHLMGTKIGCREGDCGACTVLVGELSRDWVTYQTMTSCLTPLTNVRGKHVVTVEGINPPQGELTAVQQALVDESGTQCGFCTVGFVMSLTGFCLEKNEKTTLEQAISATDGNICRCTGYKSIERAAARLNSLLNGRNEQSPLDFAIENGIVPAYFSTIKKQLSELQDSSKTNRPFTHSPNHSLLLSGGTDLYVQRAEEMTQGIAQNLFDQTSLRGIRQVNNSIEIGGSVTVTDLMDSPLMQELFPHLKKHLKLVSSSPIRNMATVAGNLVNASPIGDLTIWLLAMNTTVVVRNGIVREIPLRDFYLGYKSLAKTADEVVETIRFQKPTGTFYFNFEKVSKRTYLDIATVNTAILLRTENNRIVEAHASAGGVAPIPLYLKKTSAFLTGKMLPPMGALLSEATEMLQSEISPISDVRGSAEYKRLLLRQLFRAHFLDVNPTKT